MEYACRYPSSMLKQSPRGVLKSCTERFYIFHRKETHVPLSLFQYKVKDYCLATLLIRKSVTVTFLRIV